ITVTNKPSPTTFAIALKIADETYKHQPLVINGSDNFKKKVINAASLFQLNINFDDENLQQEFLRKKNFNRKNVLSEQQKQYSLDTAKEIIKRIVESDAQVFASSHVDYINREKAFAKRGDCVFHSHRLPLWANDDPKKFFQAADQFEGKTNRRYVEIEFALPNELTSIEQYKQIIEPFLDLHLKDHYYTYAIHDKIGSLSNGQRHPHVHIMFSERLIDDVEKIQEREPQNFFKYPARKKNGEVTASFEDRRNHGAPRDRKWCNHSFITQMRADFAQIQNDVLEKNGFSIRVDHRSLQAQKEEAERNGDYFLAKLFDRVPEKYIGIIAPMQEENPNVIQLKNYRKLNTDNQNLLSFKDSTSKNNEIQKVKDFANSSLISAKQFIDSDEYKRNSFNSKRLQFLRQDLLKSIDIVNKWKRILISRHDAEQQAKLEYMTKEEREIWFKFFETKHQKSNLKDLIENLRKPSDKIPDAINAYNDVVDGVKKKILALDSSITLMRPSIEKIEDKLKSPDCRKNIQLVTHNILQQNYEARRHLKEASSHLNDAIERLQQDILGNKLKEEPMDTFTLKQLGSIISKQHKQLKKEYEKSLDLNFALQSKIISPYRALEMAKNIFVNGDFKKLREQTHLYKKKEQLFNSNFADFNRRQAAFYSSDRSDIQEQYYLNKQRILLPQQQKELDSLKSHIDNEQVRLCLLCDNPNSQQKINAIASGILHKNLKYVKLLQQTEFRLKDLHKQINHSKRQIDAIKERLHIDKPHTLYRFVGNENIQKPDDNNSIAAIIADAILREPEAAQLVARLEGGLEMDKNWDLMSELDKDELEFKRMLREL
ncbi:MAG: MobA/MobL family protein, partial [Selenomonadaceae bacterium]|nr:MobA/MobL family protein [Selenomonadaceae bacterium]